jgi:Ubiquitin family
MEDDRTLQHYHIAEGSTVHLITRLRTTSHVAVTGWEGATMFIYLYTLTGKKIILPVNPDETIDTVKRRIQDNEGYPPGKQ